jgi:hypothetical protein
MSLRSPRRRAGELDSETHTAAALAELAPPTTLLAIPSPSKGPKP